MRRSRNQRIDNQIDNINSNINSRHGIEIRTEAKYNTDYGSDHLLVPPKFHERISSRPTDATSGLQYRNNMGYKEPKLSRTDFVRISTEPVAAPSYNPEEQWLETLEPHARDYLANNPRDLHKAYYAATSAPNAEQIKILKELPKDIAASIRETLGEFEREKEVDEVKEDAASPRPGNEEKIEKYNAIIDKEAPSFGGHHPETLTQLPNYPLINGDEWAAIKRGNDHSNVREFILDRTRAVFDLPNHADSKIYSSMTGSKTYVLADKSGWSNFTKQLKAGSTYDVLTCRMIEKEDKGLVEDIYKKKAEEARADPAAAVAGDGRKHNNLKKFSKRAFGYTQISKQIIKR